MKITKPIKIVFLVLTFLLLAIALLSYRRDPTHISYGVSFSKPYSDWLGLPFKETFISILDDLKVRKFRLSAYWSTTEPQKNVFDFNDLDFQISEASKRNAEIVLAIGRRLPRWPECHIPDWAKDLTWSDQKKEILNYLEKTVLHYKNFENIKYWQVENEPYLTEFAKEHCGELDQDFLKEEVALVKKLDSTRPILLTDSGNLGLWYGAWKNGDIFGTSVYIYLWNQKVGQVKTFFWPSYYKFKTNLMSLIFGSKKSVLIELSLEPWLIEPIKDAPIQTQIERMDTKKVDEIIAYAKKTGYDEQYLWGVEWWYLMKEKGYPIYWQKAKDIFVQ